MTAVETLERKQRASPAPAALEITSAIAGDEAKTKLDLEMENILEEAGQPRAKAQARPAGWSYRVPFAGVRYYSF